VAGLNRTNGATPRRWMVLSNPRLTRLLKGAIGEGWMADLSQLKRSVKEDFSKPVRRSTGILIDPASLFDV
jgi:starch phosphorylase